MRDDGRRRHREGIARFVARLDSLGALKPGLDQAAAADIVAAMTDPQVVRTFVDDYGWTCDRWHAWTLGLLADSVLCPTYGTVR